jgi:hypothetical protein
MVLITIFVAVEFCCLELVYFCFTGFVGDYNGRSLSFCFSVRLLFWSLIMLAQLSHAWWLFIVLGAATGIISGTLGLGGGTVVVPVLVLVCHFGQKSAQGMALAVMVPMAFVGAVRYWRLGMIEMNWVVVGLMVCGALVGAVIGTELASRVPAHVLRKGFSIFLVMVAFKMFTASPKSEALGFEGGSVSSSSVNSTANGDGDDADSH